jgi:hypothetical protein
MNAWKLLTLAGGVALVICPLAMAQNPIPNPGFESWSAGEPVGWYTSNSGGPITITQTTPGHSGSSAVRGEVAEPDPGFPITPTLQAGETGEGFPTNKQWAQLEGYYKLNAVGGDQILVSVSFLSSALGGVGGGVGFVSAPATSFQKFTIPFFWNGADLPDTCVILVMMMGPGFEGQPPHLGSYFVLDDLAFGETAPPVCPVVMTGDVNQSGDRSTSDIIYLVNAVLKGGPAPLPCPAAGDVNCDHNLATSDIIYLVNSVLKGGPAPCDVCTMIPSPWSCP